MVYIPGKWKNSYNSVSPHLRTSWGGGVEGHSVNPPTFIGGGGLGSPKKRPSWVMENPQKAGGTLSWFDASLKIPFRIQFPFYVQF